MYHISRTRWCHMKHPVKKGSQSGLTNTNPCRREEKRGQHWTVFAQVLRSLFLEEKYFFPLSTRVHVKNISRFFSMQRVRWVWLKEDRNALRVQSVHVQSEYEIFVQLDLLLCLTWVHVKELLFDRPGTPLRTASLRLRTVEKGLDESLASSHRAVEPGVLLSETRSALLLMPAQPIPGECLHKYK